jgi:hypothetical protein
MSLNPKGIYARTVLLKGHVNSGDLVSIDSSLIDATLSMAWADYREGTKKAKVNIGFNINQSIPSKIFLDRYYLSHKNFDDWLRRRDPHLYVGYVRQQERKL